MPGHSRARRERGRLRNIANQLAQLTVGWEFCSEGQLLRDATEGVLTLDIIGNRAYLNERPVTSFMLDSARDWLSAELMRLRRNQDWVRDATVEIRYRLRGTSTKSELWRGVELTARAHVSAEIGEEEATFTNSQVVGNFPYKPIASLWAAVKTGILDARARVDWGAAEAYPDRHYHRLAEVEVFEVMFRFLQQAQLEPPRTPLPLLGHEPTIIHIERALSVINAAISQYEAAAADASQFGDQSTAAINSEAATTARRLKEFVAGIPCRPE